jgi:hypothetical protein
MSPATLVSARCAAWDLRDRRYRAVKMLCGDLDIAPVADLQVGHLRAGEGYVLDLVAEVDLGRLRALEADDPTESIGVVRDAGPDFVDLVLNLWFRLEGTGRVIAASPR